MHDPTVRTPITYSPCELRSLAFLCWKSIRSEVQSTLHITILRGRRILTIFIGYRRGQVWVVNILTHSDKSSALMEELCALRTEEETLPLHKKNII